MRTFLFFIPFISAGISWCFYRLAIGMLFYPKKPIKVLGITFQGYFPKKQQQILLSIGAVISAELISFSEIEQKISDPANVKKLLPVLEGHIDIFLREKLPVQIPMLGMFIGEKTISQVKGVFMNELEELFPVLMTQYLEIFNSEIDFEKIIADKITSINSEKVENVIKNVVSIPLRMAGNMWTVLGFIVGLVQILLTIAVIYF